jgi:hypothetical protein
MVREGKVALFRFPQTDQATGKLRGAGITPSRYRFRRLKLILKTN